ncbi:Histone-like transcription factor (CBF/NF-Y) and archaeal histone [Ceratobasidium sp. AG-Ba]|nr:Histone-like transcription factor (CBF/NF-Y) and archaeal histone [Ceratobasidium sp. AG-Ba]QRW15083.1 Histone-like transcription factor (CBF/NF-Y) and archaeal histone [Ceratobasidium sp. AG-Ba]
MSPPGPFVQPGDTLEGFLRYFWQCQIATAEREDPDFKHPPLPLARIKKVMKSDPDVKANDFCRWYAYPDVCCIKPLIVLETAPILFSKACEIFISEVTARAYLVAEQHKRRTLAKADVARALSKSDQFDFLIDIVPREEGTKRSTRGGTGRSDVKPPTAGESSTSGDVNVARAPIVADPGPAEGMIREGQAAQDLLTQPISTYPVPAGVGFSYPPAGPHNQ